jgi:hypothetical protein
MSSLWRIPKGNGGFHETTDFNEVRAYQREFKTKMTPGEKKPLAPPPPKDLAPAPVRRR